MVDWLIHIDRELMLFLNGFHSPFFDFIMWWTSDRFIWIPLYLLILVLFIRKFKSLAFWPILITLMAVAMSDFFSAHIIKEGIHRLRPTYDPVIGQLVHTVHGYTGGLYGFVSSHAANTFALATMSYLFIRSRPLTVFIFAWAIFVSYSRIYLGVHYPADVFCGALFGSLLALVLYFIWLKIPFFHPTR
jgi:undecaprenyl-diphosphatase